MANARSFIAPGVNIDHLGVHLTNWLDGEGFQSQSLRGQDNSVIIQTRKRGAWRNVLGMSSALTVRMQNLDDNLRVEMTAAKWIDKALVGTISTLVFWPTLITTAYGAWEQMKLPDRIFAEIDQYVQEWNARATMQTHPST